MELLPMLLLFGLLGLMMYFMSRKQRRAQEQQQALQNSLAVGDQVMTTSGLYGTVTDVDDDSKIGVEIAPGVETVWLRAAVREKVAEDLDEEAEELEELSDSVDDRDGAVTADSKLDDVVTDTKDAEPSLESGKQK
jgi:preprotein translocase subunit YajC